jgi:penicillin-binding protein 2
VPKDKKFFYWIQKALVETVQKGTGKSARVKGLLVAGKTGTAQVISSKWLREKKGRRWEHHAWFVSYAGRRAPEIITAILIEHGGHGGSAAAPIAGEFYKNCFNMTSESNHENR